MGDKKRPKKVKPKKITRLKSETKMAKENEKALKVIRAFKGMIS